MPTPTVNIYTDGLCLPNPGGFTCWAWLAQFNGKVIARDAGCIGHGDRQRHTNNAAEYEAVIPALEWCYHMRFRMRAKGFAVHIHSDSQLVVNQVNGIWACHSDLLGLYLKQWTMLAEQVEAYIPVTVSWIPRERNAQADALSQRAYTEARRAHVADRRARAAGREAVVR